MSGAGIESGSTSSATYGQGAPGAPPQTSFAFESWTQRQTYLVPSVTNGTVSPSVRHSESRDAWGSVAASAVAAATGSRTQRPPLQMYPSSVQLPLHVPSTAPSPSALLSRSMSTGVP